jgi:hypothetical protein
MLNLETYSEMVAFMARPSFVEKINSFCESLGCTKSEIIRRAIIEYIKKHEET